MVVTTDDWRDTQEREIIDTTIPPTNDLESAIVATLDPGAYTAIVSGKDQNRWRWPRRGLRPRADQLVPIGKHQYPGFCRDGGQRDDRWVYCRR